MDGVNLVSLRGAGPGDGLRVAPKTAAGEFRRVFEDAGAKSSSVSINDPRKIADAARSFEALMIGQVLKAAHGDGSGGWLGAGEDDESSSTAIQMAEEYLGQAIANGGGLGIAKLVIQGLEKGSPTASSSGSANTVPSKPGTD
jgi:Rod binding domain-containing protein